MLDQISNAPNRETMNNWRSKLIALTFDHPDKDAIKDRGVEAMMRFDHKQAGIEPMENFNISDEKANVGESWICFCGHSNSGKFCMECGTKKISPEDIECSECSWTMDEGTKIPTFCPNCGKKFDSDDIR